MWVSLRSLSQRCQLKLKAWECPWFRGKPTVAHCRPLVDGISTIQYSNWASISFFEKLYGAEVINSFLWNGATDKPYAARIAWSDINPPQKECWLGLCKNMAAIMRIYVWQTLTLPVTVHRQLNCFLSYQLDNGMDTSQVRKVGMPVFKINCLTSKLHAWISWSELRANTF